MPIRELSVDKGGLLKTYFIGPVREGGREEVLAGLVASYEEWRAIRGTRRTRRCPAAPGRLALRTGR